MKRSIKRFGTVLAVVLVLVLLASFCFFIAESDHDCSGEDCGICRQLILCTDILNLIKHVFPVLAACMFAAVLTRIHIFFGEREYHFRYTPVSYKVKLSI